MVATKNDEKLVEKAAVIVDVRGKMVVVIRNSTIVFENRNEEGKPNLDVLSKAVEH